MAIILILFLLIATAIGYWRWSKHQTRQQILTSSLSEHERTIIFERVPIYQRIPQELRTKLEGKINLFLHQVEFIGCDGLDVTEEMELSIAAQACLLVANKAMWYKNLQTVLIYPGAFKSRTKEHQGYVVVEREVVRIGESWARGPVILSWAHTDKGAFIDDDGHNVVLHEFAHQLDDLSGYTDCAPILQRDHSQGEWNRAFFDAFTRLVKHVNAGHKTFIDPYGATAPEEFFAVVVELFLERPKDLKNEEPQIYEQLSKFFKLHPIDWV
jgi:Mlc titration factor MtfA (ptsG expression regulator)